MMTTFYRRRQYRDRHIQPTFADLVKAEALIGFYGAMFGDCAALLILLAVFGDRFLAIFGG